MSEIFILCIPLMPLLAFFINGLFGRWTKEVGGWIAFGAMLISAVISLLLFVSALLGSADLVLPVTPEPLWEWISVGDLSISVGLHFDQLTAVMCFVITFVGSLVFLYSIGYMHGDPGFSRFFTYLSLFAFAMLILVLADSLPLLFVGWEGVGLCSYLLIGYYMDAPGAADAGKKAFIVNRVGDFGFLLAMFLIYKYTGTLKISEINATAIETFQYGGAAITAITLLMFLGCTGKSAQIPLFIWLPDAMAGPTPVSALIHAATMVTAGIYLVVRTSVLFALAPATMTTMAVIGALTAFVAGTIALTQRDIKKVLAYSTVSQLGYMFLACGVGAFSMGIFHVMTHAFFKGCLFLGAGAVIHSIGGVQDLFQMGGLRKHIKTTWVTFGIACLAIAGFPLTAGFFSKDEILFKTFVDAPVLHIGPLDLNLNVLYFIGVVTAFMTAIYSFRVFFLCFHGETRLPSEVRSHVHPPGATMKIPLVILAIGSLFIGFLNVPHGIAQTFGMGESGAIFERYLAVVTEPAAAVIAAHRTEPGAEVEIAAVDSGHAAVGHDAVAHDEQVSAEHASGDAQESHEETDDVAALATVAAAEHGAEHGSAEEHGTDHGSAGAHHSVALELGLAAFSIVLALAGIGTAAYLFLGRWPNASSRLGDAVGPLRQFSERAWWWDDAYNKIFAGGTWMIGVVAVWFDHYLIDGVLHGIARMARGGAAIIRSLQMGQVQAYAMIMLIGANILLLVILIW